ncbi:MAG: DNA internalization-related competence protein ComEC/Rec2 [Methylococcales bacterium]|nr:DNA internalization-related competence protein ComEC/Rec2 [Methylococcales bacterium]
MILSALSFLAGLVLVQQFQELPGSQWLIAVTVAVGIMAWLRHWRWVFFVMGLLWAIVFAMARLSDRLPESLEGIEIPVKGIIAGLPEQDERLTRFDFIIIDSAKKLPSKLRLSWYFPDQAIKAGQHWFFVVKLKRPHGSLNPGGFDYERWLFTQGIGATGYVRPTPKPVLLGRDPAWASISVWRQSIADRLSRLLNNSSGLALIKALTIGDGSSITQNQWDVFRKTGTIHLVVISGSHVGLIAGLIYFLALKAWAWTGLLAWSPQRVAAIAAMLAAVFYSALAGFSVPTQRSVIMLAIVMSAIFLQRNTRPFNTLAVALFAVLAFDPLAVLTAGFWLSFLAVSLIVYAVAGRLGKSGYFHEVLKINWVTSVGLSPLLLFFFQQVSLISPVANFIAVPVISLLAVPMSLLAVLLMFSLPVAASKLLIIVDKLLQGLWWLLERLAGLPLATINHAPPPVWALAFAIPGVLLMLAPRGMPARWLSLVMFLPLVFTAPQKPATGAISMTLLDIGQGLSAVVQTANHWLVYDTGVKFSAESDTGRSVVLPFLRQQGASKIDKLIISHGDNDHIGGAVSLLRAMPAGQVLTSAPKQLSDYSPTQCAAGQSWTWDKVKFTFLSPPQQAFASENDNSCVLKIQSEQGAVLMTSDIEASAESWLTKTYGKSLKAGVLIAPHHGSKTSSTLKFLQTVRPEYVLIPAGYRNQFGHPHREVLARYEQIKSEWLNTADSGAITINVKDGSWVVQSMRDKEDKYWNVK